MLGIGYDNNVRKVFHVVGVAVEAATDVGAVVVVFVVVFSLFSVLVGVVSII